MYYPLICVDLIVKTELNFGDRSEWIMVERDPAPCELHDRDVCFLCGWPKFRKKSCVLVSLVLIYFIFLFKICSYLELDITLYLNNRVYFTFSYSCYFSKLPIV
jgi:hypothetical protein